MDMMLVLGILSLIYFLSVTLLCMYRFKIDTRVWNAVFIGADAVAFSCWTYASYQFGWLKEGWLTLDNISPFTFTLILLTPLLKDKVREYANSAIAFLCVGMFVAMLVSPEHSYLFSFRREESFIYVSEAVCHMICSLYGIYLVLTKQIAPTFVNWIKSAIVLYSVITLGVVINYVYHRSYFGMDPYGGASIYMLDIFNNFYATLVAYLFGVALVLTLGMQLTQLLESFTSKMHRSIAEDGKKTEESTSEDAVSLCDPELGESKDVNQLIQ